MVILNYGLFCSSPSADCFGFSFIVLLAFYLSVRWLFTYNFLVYSF
jgi:hypothetical protein